MTMRSVLITQLRLTSKNTAHGELPLTLREAKMTFKAIINDAISSARYLKPA